MYYAKRPNPLTCAAAGSIFTTGLVSIVARGIEALTSFTIADPFNAILFVTSTAGTIGGGAFITWLVTRYYRHNIAALQAENDRLRKHFSKVEELVAAVKAADQQGEMNYVRLGKLMEWAKEARERHISDDDTQDLPIRRLHGIPGGGGA